MTGNKVIQTTSVIPARVRLFQPTQRPVKTQSEWLQTQWGRCKVSGQLGQRHADALEALLYCAEKRRKEDSGTIKLLVDPARVRQSLSNSTGEHAQKRAKERNAKARAYRRPYSWEGLWKLLFELRAATVEIETQKVRIMGGIIESVEATKVEKRIDPLTRQERSLWTVRLGKAWTELMQRDIELRYDPAPIVRLGSGISQAVARHVLTHRTAPTGGWHIDTLVEAVVGTLEPGSQTLRDARRRLRADAIGLERMGIVIDRDRVHRVAQAPDENDDTVAQAPDTVAQAPDTVAQAPDTVAQAPDNFSLFQALSGA
jgi:hypothetical protein